MSRQKIRLSRKGPRTVTRAVYRVPLAFAEKIDPGVVERIPSPQTRSTLRTNGELSIAWIGPQLLRYCATLERRLAGKMHPSPGTPEPAAEFGREENPVLEQTKRDALTRTYRIFKRTRGTGPWWALLMTVLDQIETGSDAPEAPGDAQEQTR